ncbi:MAG: LolA family protein [Phycisphaerae bacterium]
MLRRMGWIASLGLLAALAAPALADEKVDKIEKALIEAYGNVKSFTATMKIEAEMMGMKMTQDGNIESMRDGDKSKARIEMKGSMDMGGQKMDMTSSTISDGEFTYIVSEQMGQKNAMKTKGEGRQSSDPKQIIAELKKQYDIKALDDQKVGDMDCHTLECTMKGEAGNPGSPTKQIMNFCKKTGMMIKLVGSDKEGKPMMTITMSDIKLDAKVDPARFVFKAPEGVQVMDMTGGAAAGGAAPAAGEKKPAEGEKKPESGKP